MKYLRRPPGLTRERSAVLAVFSLVMTVFAWPTLMGRSSSVVPSFQTATFPWAADPRGLRYMWPQSDQAESVFPWSALAQRTWRSLELPLWDPHSFGGGVPWSSDGVAATLYPVRALLDGLLPLWLAHDTFVLVHLALAGGGLYWLSRRWGAGHLGATIAGIGWMSNAYVWAWAPLEMVTPFFAWLPLTLAAGDKAVRDGGRRWIALAAVVFALAMVSGNIAYSLIIATCTGLYLGSASIATALRVKDGRRWREPLAASLRTLVVVALGLVLSAFALIPTLVNLSRASRQPFSFETLTASLMVPFEVYGRAIQLPDSPPTAEQIVHMVYLTPAVLLLALVGLLLSRKRGAWSARLMLVAAILIASTVPGAWLAYHLLPGFDVIRPYGRLLPIALMAVCVLSGLGADAVWGWTTARSWSRRWLAIPTAVALAAAVFVPSWAVATTVDPPYLSVDDHPPFPTTPLIKSVRRVDRSTLWRERIIPATSSYDTTPPSVGPPTFVGGTALAPGLDTWGGYSSAVPARSSELVRLVSGEPSDVVFADGPTPELTYPHFVTDAVDWDLACRMGSDLVTAAPAPAEGVHDAWGSLDPALIDQVYSGPDGRVFALPDGCASGPYVTTTTTVAESDEAAIEELREQGADALSSRRSAPTERRVVLSDTTQAETSSEATGRLTGMLRDGSQVVAQIETTGDMWLVLPIAYDEGWSVEVDGTSVDTERVDFNRLGLRVGDGTSEVVVTYHPPGWTIGLLLSTLGGAAVALMLVPRRRRRENAPSAR